ncbi:MAG TPA: cysteine desulfurase, partial [Acidobacteriota bacterium]|nr:cysteine desulfurase [Acidobacteriota bacterium]
MQSDLAEFRKDFPALAQTVRGKQLVYLDNAATALKPQCVVDAVSLYNSRDTANVHRGVYYLSEKATAAYEGVRTSVKQLLNASDPGEIVFARGTTEAINLVAASYGRTFLRAGDEIVLTTIEHHSNIVPWQLICGQTGARLRIAPVNDHGECILEEYEKLLSDRTRIVSIGHVSNAIGTIHPIKRMTTMAHQAGAVVLLDGAQAAPHMPVDVRDIDCDFYAFSGHKLYGPTGIGVLYGKAHLLGKMPPYQGGGEMIHSVSFDKTDYKNAPYKFEAGTPAIAEAIGLGAAVEYVRSIGLDRIASREGELLSDATSRLSGVTGLKIIGNARDKAAIVSFVLDGIHPHDIATIL